MSIGRIEMVDGVKKNVVYATLGGTGGIQVGNVQDLSIEENADNLTLKWKDPDNVVFNGETIAEWAGTKVVRKEGSNPKSVEDGTLIIDNTVKDQYAVEGLQDTDVLDDSQYNYALFPYTTKNVYTMSDLNRASSGFGGYDPIFENNSWSKIAKASREGTASNIWSVGDVKDGYVIIGFDHDDLADGTGKAGITFASGAAVTTELGMGVWANGSTFYDNSIAYTVLENRYENFKSDIKMYIKKVKKIVKKSLTGSDTKSIDVDLFLFSMKELFGSTSDQYNEGIEYEGIESLTNIGLRYWTRTRMAISGSSNVYIVLANGNQTYQSAVTTDVYYRYGFCI